MNKSRISWRPLCFALAFCALLSACATSERPVPETAPVTPLQPARWSDLSAWKEDDLSAAWPAFLQSCRGFAKRPGGLDWKAVCEEAGTLSGQDRPAIRRFFESRFTPYRLTRPDGSAQGLVTGYYEPLLRGSRTRTAKYSQPVFGVPDDLLTVDLSGVLPELKHLRLRGRLSGRRVIPYFSRTEIEEQKLAESHPEKVLLWVEDAVELFFLQIQGSGQVELPDAHRVRLAYADHNGHPYRSIGQALAERGELPLEKASMQGIQAWARANPARLGELLRTNPAYVFFRETPVGGEGPTGAFGVPLTPGRSLAVDPRYVPLGAPVFLLTTEPLSKTPLARLMLAQDTGGAIRGAVRADFFWGSGAEALAQAGRMKQAGAMWVLLPKGLGPSE
jgi:membrane-bound lytic murein transglycosylase A